MSKIDLSGLRDADPERQQKAALAIYESGNLTEFKGNAEATAALRASVAAENKSAAAVLLLGYDSSPATVDLLRSIRDRFGTKLAKLKPWTSAVPLSLVVDVSLSRLGDSKARLALLEEVEKASVETMSFLLEVLREIDDPTLLHSISRALDDERPVRGGVPSGATPARRLSDVAVDAFVDRLKLPVGFDRESSRRYSEASINEVKRLIAGGLPR